MIRNIYIMLLCLALGGCAAPAANQSIPAADATVCEDQRPEVCTMDYRPVCANLADGSNKTYSNGCGACSDANVNSWVEGECPE